MRQLILFILSCLTFSNGIAQSLTGLTGIPDTSYTVHSAFQSSKKTYPFIELAKLKNPISVRVEKNIIYKTGKGRNLTIDIFINTKKSSNKNTAIILLHGGGWRSGNKSIMHPLAETLAERGYVCFTPQYTLSTDALFPASVNDVKESIHWVRKNAAKYRIDPNKIVIAGHSAGGELAAFAGTTWTEKSLNGHKDWDVKPNAVINMDGTLAFIHPESGEGEDSKKISAATYWFGYSKTENPDLWKQASPLTHVNKLTPPTLFINSSIPRMRAGRDDYIKIANELGINTEIKQFDNAPHNFILFEPWFSETVPVIDQFLKKIFEREQVKLSRNIRVAQDGLGDFRTVTEAIQSIPYNNLDPVVIYIKNGVYKEKVLIDSTKNNVILVGEDQFRTILTYNDHTGKIAPSGDTINTRTSWTFKIMGNNFKASKLTFQNDAGFTAGQAVAVESDGDMAEFTNCRFIGNQDVLFTNNENSRQYFKDCYIEGTTDFIFGSATVWFERCHIHSKKNSHITAASTSKEKEFGYIFNRCFLTGDTSLHNVSLGRPWRPFAQVTYMNSYLGPHIKPEGWSNWNNTENHLTTRYFEYKNYGPGANSSGRVKWSKHLSEEEIKRITIDRVLNGWNPANH